MTLCRMLDLLSDVVVCYMCDSSSIGAVPACCQLAGLVILAAATEPYALQSGTQAGTCCCSSALSAMTACIVCLQTQVICRHTMSNFRVKMNVYAVMKCTISSHISTCTFFQAKAEPVCL